MYSITGAFTHFSGADYVLTANAPTTGTLLYPGVGKATTELLLQSASPKTGVAMQLFTAFPPVPAGGLDGWTPAPNFNAVANGTLKQGGASADLRFTIRTFFKAAPAPSQGTIGISAGGCSETLSANFLRIGAFPAGAP